MEKILDLDLKTEFKRAIIVAKFDQKVMRAVAHDRALTRPALFFIILSSLAGAAGSLIFPIRYGEVIYVPTFFDALFNAISAIFFVGLVLYVLNFIADRFFQGKGTFLMFFRVVGYGYVVGILNLFPVLNFAVGIWMLILLWKILIYVKELTPRNAVFTLVILMVLGVFFGMLWGNLNPGDLYGRLYVMPTSP